MVGGYLERRTTEKDVYEAACQRNTGVNEPWIIQNTGVSRGKKEQ
jgi:hypothetical protein